jgi:hypothetical protein
MLIQFLLSSASHIASSDRLWALLVLKTYLKTLFTPILQTPNLNNMTDNSNNSHNSTRDGLPKLEDDGQVNNYRDLLKYVSDPDSTPPNIPELCEPFIQRGSDPTDPSGTLKVFCVHGNAAKRDRAIEDAKPWMSHNTTALSKIVNVISRSQMHIVNDALYARDAWNNLRRRGVDRRPPFLPMYPYHGCRHLAQRSAVAL